MSVCPIYPGPMKILIKFMAETCRVAPLLEYQGVSERLWGVNVSVNGFLVFILFCGYPLQRGGCFPFDAARPWYKKKYISDLHKQGCLLNHKLLRCLRLKTLLTPALPPSRSQKGRSRRCTGTWSADWLVCSTRGSSLARRPPPSPLSPRRILCFQAAKDLVSLPPGASR